MTQPSSRLGDKEHPTTAPASGPDPASPSTILLPALKAGFLTGSLGVMTGGAIATLKSSPTIGLFACVTGLHWFSLGSTYWGARAWLSNSFGDNAASCNIELSGKHVLTSGAAGALSGATTASLFRGPKNVIPGAIMWGIIGATGQYAYNIADKHHYTGANSAGSHMDSDSGLWARAAGSKWNPVKRLTSAEYETMLQERLLGVEAEISLLDEKISSLKSLYAAKPPKFPDNQSTSL